MHNEFRKRFTKIKKEKALKESAIAQLRKRSKDSNARPRAEKIFYLTTLTCKKSNEKKENPIRKTTTGKGANYRKTKSGAGMTAKGVKAYRAANPGSKLKTAVTGKVKKGSAAAKRRKSYCARSAGQLRNSSAKTRNDPNSRIRQARRRWKC